MQILQLAHRSFLFSLQRTYPMKVIEKEGLLLSPLFSRAIRRTRFSIARERILENLFRNYPRTSNPKFFRMHRARRKNFSVQRFPWLRRKNTPEESRSKL